MEGWKIKKNTRDVLCGWRYSYRARRSGLKTEFLEESMRLAGNGQRERKTGAQGGKKKAVAPFLLFLTSCSQSVDPQPNTQPQKHTRTYTHAEQLLFERGVAPRSFYWWMGGREGRKTQLWSISPSKRTRRLFFVFCFFCFSQIKTEQEVRKTWIAFWFFFLASMHAIARYFTPTGLLFLFFLFMIRQLNPTHVSRLGAPIPASDNPSLLEARCRRLLSCLRWPLVRQTAEQALAREVRPQGWPARPVGIDPGWWELRLIIPRSVIPSRAAASRLGGRRG